MSRSSRTRRTAAESRKAILDAAESRFLAGGPASLRLQEIAEEVGVSHPTILHHFGSREGLVRAVVERALETLEVDLLRALAEPEVERIDVSALLDRILDTLDARGQARMLAWLALSGPAEPGGRGAPRRLLGAIAELVHARRGASRAGPGEPPGYDDTRFTVMLAALALLGDALLGDAIRSSIGLGDDPDSARRFRVWLARLLVGHLGGAHDDGAKR